MTFTAFVVALLLIVAGVGMIYLPAGLIVAGALTAVCAIRYESGTSESA